MKIRNVKLTNDEIKTKNFILIITSILVLVLGISFFFSKYITLLESSNILCSNAFIFWI